MNKRAFALGAAMVLLCNFVAVTLRSYAESAFVTAYGPSKLPWLLIASAGGFAVATFAYDAVTRRAHTRVVDVALLGLLLVAAASAPLLLGAGVSPVVLVVALSAASQVAGLALWNRVAAAVAGRDARRMLPRAGAAVTLGGAIAGLGAGALVYRLGVAVLPVLGAVVTAIVLGIAIAQHRALAAGGAPGAAAPPGTSETLGDMQKRLLGALIAVALLEGVVTTIIDLQFIALLKGRYHAAFPVALMLFYGGTNTLLFLLQVLAVPRVLVTRSLTTTAAIHPLLAIGWYALFVVAPGLVAMAGTRTADQVLRLATSRTSQEIELSAFPPGPRARWKVLLRGGMWPAGAALAALVLLLVGPVATQQLALIAIAIAVVWCIAAQIAARRFQAALAAPLGIRTHRVEDLRRIDLDTLERWAHVAGSTDARTSAVARAAMARAQVAPSDLADHLRHDEPAVRAALFEQLARSPAVELRGELAAAVSIEDDDRALALGLEALALTSTSVDDAVSRALARGRSRAPISRDVATALRSAEATLAATSDELPALVARDPDWAVALATRVSLADDALATLLLAAPRASALHVIARIGPDATIAVLDAALSAGDTAAIATLDERGAQHLASKLAQLSVPARIAIARALAGAPAAVVLVAALLDDEDPEVAQVALRTALALARGGSAVPASAVTSANTRALDALLAHLDARDAAAPWSAVARAELERATQRCVVRLLWAAALAVAAAGRDPATLAATARRLIGGKEPDRRRALDVVQETQTGRAEILAVIERWLRPAQPADDADDAQIALSLVDPWLAALAGRELQALEPRLAALRASALFATVPGPALAAFAEAAIERCVDGPLFERGAAGASMFVVMTGALITQRPGGPDRRVEAGGVVGELAVLTQAPRAASVIADHATVLEIDRAAFAAATRRAPELVLGMSATLAGWLAPERPDVLG